MTEMARHQPTSEETFDADAEVPTRDISARQRSTGRGAIVSASREIEGRDSVGLYLEEIAREELLDAETEVELAKTIEAGLMAEHLLNEGRVGRKNGGAPLSASQEELKWLAQEGQVAFDRFLTANLRLVVSLVRKYGRSQMPMLDMIQEGNAGLIRAVEKYDYTQGYKFSTYATWWIRQGITRGIANQAKVVRLPVHVVEEVNQLGSARRALERDLGREPEPEEIAAELGITTERVLDLMAWGRDYISLDTPLDETGEATVNDLIGDEIIPAVDEQVVSLDRNERLRALINRLDERSADIIRRRYGFADGRAHSYEEISNHHGISHETARQIAYRALRRLRWTGGDLTDDDADKLVEKLGPREEKKLELFKQLEAVRARMDPEQAELIEAYIDSKSYAAAAERVNMSAPSFTRSYTAAKKALLDEVASLG